MSRGTFALVLAGALGAFGCGSNLPTFAHPTGKAIDPGEMEGRDRIAYRELVQADFLAAEPPPEMRQYAQRMGAVTCAHVFTEPEPRYFIAQDERGFSGGYENLSFVARMDRDCSWWNPVKGTVPFEYILQHEQIHFALAESAARQLDAHAKKLVTELRPQASTQEQVERELVSTVEEMMNAAMEDLLKRNKRFDEATSNTYAPKVQQRWYDDVMDELR